MSITNIYLRFDDLNLHPAPVSRALWRIPVLVVQLVRIRRDGYYSSHGSSERTCRKTYVQ